MSQLTQLQERLARTPGDWELRVRVVEALALLENVDEARRFVREAPETPVPYHLQTRIWNALSPSAGVTVEVRDEVKPILKARARTVAPSQSPPGERTGRKSAGASLRPSQPSPSPVRLRVQPRPPEIESATFRLEALPGEPSAEPGPKRDRSRASSHLCALAVALFFHLVLAVLFSAIALRSYSLVPAHITVVAPPAEEETEIEKRKLVRKVKDSKPASPSRAGASLLTADVASPVAVPSFENREPATDFNVVDAGMGFSQGLSFEAEGVESAVNFFGIESGSQSMVFIADATPHMLLDEKGGMIAYDKVKQEIASMLQSLHRGTVFNLILYEGKRLRLFRQQPVRALPSTVRKAIDWLDPVNRDYHQLGLGRDAVTEAVQPGAEPVRSTDIAHYSKAIQAALEQEAQAIFCITSGWREMRRSLSPEDQKRLDEARERRRQLIESMDLPEPDYDPRDVERWRKAQQKARDWLAKENAARAERGLPPKVVLDFGALVRKLSPGAAPPRRIDDRPELPPLAVDIPRPPPYTPEDVETHIRNLVQANYGPAKPDHPALHMVLFLGEDESLDEVGTLADYEEHFRNLTRRNKGQLKVLRGLAALENVTELK